MIALVKTDFKRVLAFSTLSQLGYMVMGLGAGDPVNAMFHLTTHAMFKGLLLIPVAALIVVIMRVLVGLKTSGTFMPILIALAFLQTKLLPGLAIFIILVSVGLWIRSWLSHMKKYWASF